MHFVRHVSLALALTLTAVLAAACVTPPAPPPGAAVRHLGDAYRTSVGEVYMIRVQDEYILIRCIPEGPIAGCYQDVYRIQRDAIKDEVRPATGVRWNEWLPVPSVPGLEIMFLTPDTIALRELQATPTK